MSVTTCLRCGHVYYTDLCIECGLPRFVECEDFIRCPWCNELIDPYLLRVEHIVCHHCGKRIRVEKRVMYDSYPALDSVVIP